MSPSDERCERLATVEDIAVHRVDIPPNMVRAASPLEESDVDGSPLHGAGLLLTAVLLAYVCVLLTWWVR